MRGENLVKRIRVQLPSSRLRPDRAARPGRLVTGVTFCPGRPSGPGRRGLPATSSPVPAGSSSRTPACGYQTVGNDHGSTGLDSRSTLSHVPQACTERPRTQGGSACGACVLSQVSVSLSLVHTHTPLGSCTANLSAAPQLAPGVGKGAAGALPPSPAPVHPSALPDSRERPSDKTRRQHLPYICEEKT